jgi:hypothetical protein
MNQNREFFLVREVCLHDYIRNKVSIIYIHTSVFRNRYMMDYLYQKPILNRQLNVG